MQSHRRGWPVTSVPTGRKSRRLCWGSIDGWAWATCLCRSGSMASPGSRRVWAPRLLRRFGVRESPTSSTFSCRRSRMSCSISRSIRPAADNGGSFVRQPSPALKILGSLATRRGHRSPHGSISGRAVDDSLEDGARFPGWPAVGRSLQTFGMWSRCRTCRGRPRSLIWSSAGCVRRFEAGEPGEAGITAGRSPKACRGWRSMSPVSDGWQERTPQVKNRTSSRSTPSAKRWEGSIDRLVERHGWGRRPSGFGFDTWLPTTGFAVWSARLGDITR